MASEVVKAITLPVPQSRTDVKFIHCGQQQPSQIAQLAYEGVTILRVVGVIAHVEVIIFRVVGVIVHVEVIILRVAGIVFRVTIIIVCFEVTILCLAGAIFRVAVPIFLVLGMFLRFLERI